jgi:hypothetical protein
LLTGFPGKGSIVSSSGQPISKEKYERHSGTGQRNKSLKPFRSVIHQILKQLTPEQLLAEVANTPI